MKLKIEPDSSGCARCAASLVSAAICSAIADRGVAVVVLAGGNTPAYAYRLMAQLEIDWSNVILIPGDERCVPSDDPDANQTMIRRELIDRLDPAAVPRYLGPPLGLAPKEAALAWQQELAELGESLSDGLKIDIALLGLGEDCHTASLFPNSPQLKATGLAAPVKNAPKPPPGRVTLTLEFLGSARERVLLAVGAGKSSAVTELFSGSRSEQFPASLLPDQSTTLLCDQAAAAQLTA